MVFVCALGGEGRQEKNIHLGRPGVALDERNGTFALGFRALVLGKVGRKDELDNAGADSPEQCSSQFIFEPKQEMFNWYLCVYVCVCVCVCVSVCVRACVCACTISKKRILRIRDTLSSRSFRGSGGGD